MFKLTYWICCFLLGALLVGCQVRAPQLERLQSIFDVSFVDLSEYEWTIEAIGYKAKVVPITLDKGAIFASYAKDSLEFDGFILNRIDTLGDFPTPLVIRGSSHLAHSERKVYFRGQLYSQQTCQKRFAIGAIARQICISDRGREWLYEMEFGDDGLLRGITQTLDEEGRQIKLKKVD